MRLRRTILRNGDQSTCDANLAPKVYQQDPESTQCPYIALVKRRASPPYIDAIANSMTFNNLDTMKLQGEHEQHLSPRPKLTKKMRGDLIAVRLICFVGVKWTTEGEKKRNMTGAQREEEVQSG